MAIIDTLTSSNVFVDWLNHDKNSIYYQYFSYDGARALFDYYDQLSDDMGENIEFDPIAWCIEWSEFKDWQEAYDNYGDGTITDPEEQKQFIDENTQTYEFDGGLLVEDF